MFNIECDVTVTVTITISCKNIVFPQPLLTIQYIFMLHSIHQKMLNLVDNGSDDAKISYLRNLMVNYLSSDPTVREHMEGAIGTVLKFSREVCVKISKIKKQTDASWFS
jgi:hypothetical protein